VPIEIGTLRGLDAGLASPGDALDQIALRPRMLAQAARVVFRFQRFHVGVELRSQRFLDEMIPVMRPNAEASGSRAANAASD
jgi:hypothetical protein